MALITANSGRLSKSVAVTGAAALLAGAVWWRAHPSACPYGQRFWVQPPHPIITRWRLREVLQPMPGERVLELGPGTGYYTLDMADWVGSLGRVDIFDLQQEMLDHTLRRATQRGLSNIAPAQGDARELTYPDASFDAAYLTAVLGEIPDQTAAIREARRRSRAPGATRAPAAASVCSPSSTASCSRLIVLRASSSS